MADQITVVRKDGAVTVHTTGPLTAWSGSA